MEQLFQKIQEIYYMLNILNFFSQDEWEELVKGYNPFLFDVSDILTVLDRIVEGCTYWGWKFDWGYQPWQLKTYRQQKGLTLQAGWEDRVDFSLDLYRDIQYKPQRIPVPIDPHRVLTPINLDTLEAREAELEANMDICKVCHIQHERPVAFHELIPDDSNSSSDTENPDVVREPPVVEEGSNLDSMPELEEEIDLDTIEIPTWLIPRGVAITFHGGRVIFEREQGSLWQEVLAQMLAEQDSMSDNV